MCAVRAGSLLTVSAAKSHLGHAETGAGAVGIATAVLSLLRAQAAPLLHLRSMNSYVQAVLETTSKDAGVYLLSGCDEQVVMLFVTLVCHCKSMNSYVQAVLEIAAKDKVSGSQYFADQVSLLFVTLLFHLRSIVNTCALC